VSNFIGASCRGAGTNGTDVTRLGWRRRHQIT
jgi:hypothetical protein